MIDLDLNEQPKASDERFEIKTDYTSDPEGLIGGSDMDLLADLSDDDMDKLEYGVISRGQNDTSSWEVTYAVSYTHLTLPTTPYV